ncbi:MAG: FAD-dependent oxidoreductase [Actinomycetota bacterium]
MTETFVIVGASATGATAAATLREEGFDGRIVLVGDEPQPPYERPPLSKEFLRGEQDLAKGFLRPPEFYAEQSIETRFGERAERIDPPRRTVVLEGGEELSFDAALIATGARNRGLDIPGADLEGVFDLRTDADCDQIKAAAAGASKAVLVGFGFIGAELAASFRQLGLEVSVVEVFPAPLFRVLGLGFGRAIEAMHRDHGVELFFQETAARFEGGGGRFEAVVTEQGRRVEGDFVVVGIGTVPNTEIAEGTEIAVDRGILVDGTLQTSVPGIYAAGDVASHQHPLFGRIRVEHLDNAEKMGPAAARNMLGAGATFDDPHWFWSDQYDSMIQMGGYTTEWSHPIIRGNVEDRSFCAFQLDEAGILRASLSLDYPRDVRRSLKAIGSRVDPAALADPDVDVRTLVGGA